MGERANLTARHGRRLSPARCRPAVTFSGRYPGIDTGKNGKCDTITMRPALADATRRRRECDDKRNLQRNVMSHCCW